jgi:hypothetical protein
MGSCKTMIRITDQVPRPKNRGWQKKMQDLTQTTPQHGLKPQGPVSRIRPTASWSFNEDARILPE